MSIKRFEQSPDSTVSFQGNPAFYLFVWPLRARLPLGTAQLKRSVMPPPTRQTIGVIGKVALTSNAPVSRTCALQPRGSVRLSVATAVGLLV